MNLPAHQAAFACHQTIGVSTYFYDHGIHQQTSFINVWATEQFCAMAPKYLEQNCSVPGGLVVFCTLCFQDGQDRFQHLYRILIEPGCCVPFVA